MIKRKKAEQVTNDQQSAKQKTKDRTMWTILKMEVNSDTLEVYM